MRRRLLLLDDVRKHAVAGRKIEPANHLFEELLEPDNRVDIVGRWIETNNHVSAAVRQSFENRKKDLLFVVSWAIRLDARAKVLRRTDGDTVAANWIEERARDARQLVVGHHFGDGGNRLTGQRVSVRVRPRRGRGPKEHRLEVGNR